MHLRKSITAAALVAGLVAASPAAAHGGGHGGPRGAQGASIDRSNVPSRITTRITRAERSLQRAVDYIDNEQSSSAAASLRSVKSNLAAALKSAKRQVGTSKGPDSLWAVSAAEHDVIDGLTPLFDGADTALVSTLSDSLDGAITGRDEAVAAIAALPAADQGDYADVVSAIDADVTEEIASIDEALADDTLSTEAQAALNDARAKLVATQTAVQALDTSSSSTTSSQYDETSTDPTANGDRPCKGHHGSSSGSGTDTGTSTTTSTTTTASSRRN
jgi:hypothetical protein